MDTKERRITIQAIWIKASRRIVSEGDNHYELSYQAWINMLSLGSANVYGRHDFWVNGFKALVF